MHGEVLDQCFLDSLDTLSQLNSLWTQRHHLQTELAQSQRDSKVSSGAAVPSSAAATIWRQAKECGIPTCLITDSAAVAEHAEAHGCQEAILIQPPIATQPAEDVEDCSVMALFVTAAEIMAQRTGFVWVHSTGLHAAWDSPIALRNAFVDPEDPDPPTAVDVPNFAVLPDTDPDAVVGWGQVAAAQASVVDQGLATLLASAAASSATWSKVLIGLGGVALGEHGYVGSLIPPSAAPLESPPALFGEVLACVAVLTKHESSRELNSAPGQRRPEIFQLPDLGASLRTLAGLDSETQDDSRPGIWGRDIGGLGLPQSPGDWPTELAIACTTHEDRLWLRCPAWSIQTPFSTEHGIGVVDPNSLPTMAEATANSQLYVKPEDRWEVNDVADRRADIVDLLRAHGTAVLDALRAGKREFNFKLEEELANLLR